MLNISFRQSLMKKTLLLLTIAFIFSGLQAQNIKIDRTQVKEDLDEILFQISQNYVYLQEKNIDLKCIESYYESQLLTITTEEDTVLFFENLLNEFYDSHLILNTNRNSSFRLYAPIYVTIKEGKAVISNIWQTQIERLDYDILGAELLEVNGLDIHKAIEQFPTHCNDKNSLFVKEWIINKILAGRYNQPRILTLKLLNKKKLQFDLDKIRTLQNSTLLTVKREKDIGIIRINNSLGNNKLIDRFDEALNSLTDTQGLIIDLRNIVDGGNSYVARGIMSRFINKEKPYQKHRIPQQFDGNPKIIRSWVEYVTPRGNPYKKPVVILVGRWTGSMGEGLAIGFEGMHRAEIVGSEMERLAGEMSGFTFKNQNYGYRLSTAKLYHLDGTPREKYIPTHYVAQTTTEKDETLLKGIKLIHTLSNQ